MGAEVIKIEKPVTGAGIPAGIVATPTRLLNDPQLRANGYIIEQEVAGIEEPVPFMGFPFRLSNHPGLEYRHAPAVGEHTEEIYRNVLHMTEEEFDALRKKNII